MSIVINRDHIQQDICRVREYNPSRKWYQFASRLIPTASPGDRIIDVGGGAGEFTEYVRSKGYRSTLVDGNAVSVQREISRGNAAFLEDFNVGLRSIPDASFEAAVCLEVIEHIVPAENLLREIHRVLKPGGFVVVSTPNFSYLADRLRYLFGADLAEEGYHYRFYTPRKLTRDLTKCGFVIERRNSVGAALGVNFLLRLLSFGKLRLPYFRTPLWLESMLASTLVYKAIRK